MTKAQEVRRGYEQFVPPQAPPGMYFDPAPKLFLPQGARLASRGQVARAWFLGLLLFIVTLGIGYITWSLFAWGQGRTPAQRILSLRCWLPEPRRVAGREQMAQRQITGFFLNGQLLSGFFTWLTSRDLRSVGDFFAHTVILHDPDGVLQLSSAAPPGDLRDVEACLGCGRGESCVRCPLVRIDPAQRRRLENKRWPGQR